MTKQEIINDILFIYARALIKAQSFTINKALKTFKATRLNERASLYTKLALVQIHRDLASLCASLNAKMYESEIEWLNDKANEIEKSNL